MTRVFRAFGLPFVLLACLAISTQASAQDADADGVVDSKDNCLGVFNPEQRDADLDGYGTECDADYDNDGTVSILDFARFGTAFNASYLDVVVDHNFDGVINVNDYAVFGSLYDLPPGPSGLACAGTAPCISCSWGFGVDQDGDGIDDDFDNCVDGANGPAQAPNDQYDANGEGYGNFCDADFNDDGQITGSDHAIFGTCMTGSFDPICDLNADGALNIGDWARFGQIFELGGRPGPSGVLCDGRYPLSTGFPYVEKDDVWLNVLQSDSQAMILPAGASYPHPLSTAVVEDATLGTVRITDGQTASFVYIPDPGTSTWADEFRLVVTDGRGFTEFTVRMNLMDDTLASFPVSELESRALVVYNVNASGAQDIAEHYVDQPARDGAALCPVEMPNGLYASKDQMLSLRKQIIEGCICPLVPVEDRPAPCEVGANLGELATVSPISHLALVRGLPARMFGTGWPANPGMDDQGDEEEPSLDYYLAYLLYRDVDLFCPTCPGPMQGENVENTFDEAPAESEDVRRTRREVHPAIDRFVSYGRVEAITPSRTMDLINRTLAAEASGFTGNLVTGLREGLAVAQRRTSSTQDECFDYMNVPLGNPGSIWPYESCRVGSTLSGVSAGGMPGAGDSHVPTAMNVGALVGNNPLAANQTGFSGFSRMRNWHRDTLSCTELCSELPSGQQVACQASSTDYFQELNTDCVGAAPGLIGMQYRSFPVGYYGFFPPGWSNGGHGRIDNTPPQILEGEGYQDATFLDDRYLHVGNASWNAADSSTCVREDGMDEPCPERVALQIRTNYFPSPAISLTEDRDFTLRLRRRHGAHPGADLRMSLEFSDGATTHVASAFISLATATGEIWTPTPAEVTLTAPASQLSTLTRVTVVLDLPLEEGVTGFLDLDAVELIDLGSGSSTNLLTPEVASFDPATRNQTHRGDFAANLIDRIGGIAAWGSSSHHLTGGHAFSRSGLTLQQLLSGISLGTSVAISDLGESGIIYADPLYRSSAALLSPIGTLESKKGKIGTNGLVHNGLTVTADNVAQASKLAVTALHGTANTATTQWSISVCPALDLIACDSDTLWVEDVDGGTGAVRYHVIDWTTYIDPQVDQLVLVRLKVWNPSTPADALYDFAFFDYQVNGS